MKKIYTLAVLIAAGAVYSQTGKVGINSSTPAATLDIQPTTANLSGTTNEGILIPRLTSTRVAAMASPTEGTMVYVTDAPASSKFSDTTKGFYYWDAAAAKWTKMGSGAAGASSNIYTADGTLSSARTVNQNNQNLTFTTGTAQFVVNGAYKGNGAIYQKGRVQALPLLDTDIVVDDYAIVLTGAGLPNVTLPNPSSIGNQNRVLSINNQSTTSSLQYLGSYPPVNNSGPHEIGKGWLLQSIYDSSSWKWYLVGGY